MISLVAAFHSFQMCAQHPSHLLMCLHQAGNEIAGTGVVQIIGEAVDVCSEMNDQAFVVGEQCADITFAVIIFGSLFRKVRQRQKIFERCRGVVSQHANALGDVIDDFV